MNSGEKFKRKAFNAVGKVINRLGQNEAMATDNLSKDVTDGMPELLRKAAAEGTVLLRNDGILPISRDKEISVFGRVQNDYIFVGYGSGGDVVKPYTVSLMEGLYNSGANINRDLADIYAQWCKENTPDHGFWGHWPHYYEEMPIETNVINVAAKRSDYAIVVIGRAAGEDRENTLTPGSYFLTEEEKSLISRVSEAFKNTVIILDVGSVIDMQWEKDLLKGNSAILIPWQGGMESGNALADVILGDKEPSGRLSDTIAEAYSCYPSANDFGNREFNNYYEDIYVGYRYFETFKKKSVLYPFGFGLGYAQFNREFIKGYVTDNTVILTVKTTCISDRAGKDVIQIYAEKPNGELGNPEKVLCGFHKTDVLQKDESAETTVEIPYYAFSSFDDSGITGYPNAYVLEKGDYKFHLGTDCRNTEIVYTVTIPETILLEQLTQVGAPVTEFKILGKGEKDVEVTTCKTNLKQIILENLPSDCGYTGNKGIKLSDVKNGKNTLDEFVAQLSIKELEAISRGAYIMNSPLGAKGNAGVMGGVLPSLRDKGISPLTTTDGPSGIRLLACCSLLPSGTALACTWNPDLAFEVYSLVGSEMKEKGSDILLGPGLNIHRNPLCGRNFEYYSEDPFLTGKIGAAVIKGIQSRGVAACPKHYACNNQETNRNSNDSRLSQRALREIYLKGFEICVKEANPHTIMTSYNKINGVWAHYNYELCNIILRKEWGFKGLVMTDWWMQYTNSPEFPNLKANAYRVRAGVDVLMPGGRRVYPKISDGTLLKTYGKPDGITLGEMQETAKNVINLVMKIK